jgi:hypothetical protein
MHGPALCSADQCFTCAVGIEKLHAVPCASDQRPGTRQIRSCISSVDVTPIDESDKRSIPNDDIAWMKVAMRPNPMLRAWDSTCFAPDCSQSRRVGFLSTPKAIYPLLTNLTLGRERHSAKRIRWRSAGAG